MPCNIDQSFVRHTVTDQNDTVIVQTIIGMAQNFHLNVTAEGVETKEQFELLQRYGCPAFQGYLFSKPLPIEEFERLLGQESAGYSKLRGAVGDWSGAWR